MKKRFLFFDRDGTLVREPFDEQVDALDKVTFLPGVFTHLGRIARLLDYELIMVTNQDGLGTTSFPEETFWPAHNFIVDTLAGEGIVFADTLIDRSFPSDHAPTRKPGTGMLTAYMDAEKYNLKDSFVIGDRESDMQLAENLGCKGLGLGTSFASEAAIAFGSWEEIASYLFRVQRQAIVQRKTRETDIRLELSLDGDGSGQISTGIGFFDHMLDQIGRHAQVEMNLHVEGDLEVDEHHTVEDTALALGEAFRVALGNKRGISRYGFEVPMDDASAKVLIDFGGRPWFIWKAQFQREKIGQFPTELLPHFFKSFSDAAGCNLHIEATGDNEHHTCEAIFKAFARAIRMAKSLEGNQQIPSTKGVL